MLFSKFTELYNYYYNPNVEYFCISVAPKKHPFFFFGKIG